MSVAASRKETAMWLLERLVPGTGVNNVAVAFETAGRLDRRALAQALTSVLARHDILRTVFDTDAATLSKRVLEPGEASLAADDIALTEAGRDADLTAFVSEPFAFDGRPLVRAGIRGGTGTDVCCVVVHHLVFDAMSTTILLGELLAAYETIADGGTPELTRVAPPEEHAPHERSIAYWRTNLDGLAPGESGLWCAKPTGATTSLRADTVYHSLSGEAREVVRRLQRELRASEAVILLAAYYVLLTHHGAGTDVVIGTPVNVRDQASAKAIGYHANLLPLRVRLDPAAGFRHVVKQARNTFLEAISHADVPLEEVSPAVLGDTPSTWRSSFFRHLFNYVPGTVDTSRTVAGMPVRYLVAENGFSRFDLEFFIMPGEHETKVRAAFRADALDAADAVLLLERYDALLVALGAEVDQPVAELSRWGATDRALLTAATHPTSTTDTVLDVVHRTVVANPDLVAIDENTGTVSYGELWSAALGTRDLVAKSGASSVALIAPRSAELGAALLGSWLAGAACVLLDPAQPPAELAAHVSDSGADLILIAAGLPVPGGVPIPAITDTGRTDAPVVDPGSLAYLEYPLATADPVAVTVTHRALASAVSVLTGRVAIEPAVTLWLSSVATDAALMELLVALTSHGRVVVAPDRARTDGQLLGDLLEQHAVSVVQAPPAVWRQVLEQAGARLAGRTVLTGHEPLTRSLAGQLRATGCRLHNSYSTPAVAGWTAGGEVDAGSDARIGASAGATVDAGVPVCRAFITEPGTLHELGIGVRGELCVTGDALAAGYHHRPELTAARFGEHPVHGRFHRTGDLASWLPDGRLEITGPLSAHVTVAGSRIHLSQIDDVLAAHPDVDAVATTVVGGSAIVAFVESHKPDVADRLREHARAALPVVPALVVLDALPWTVSSTVHHQELAQLAASTAIGPAGDVEPPDEMTIGLVAIWTELLDRPGLHADANFFASGGHSLLGAQLVQRVKTELGIPVSLGDLFANPTPRELAEHLGTAIWDDEDDE